MCGRINQSSGPLRLAIVEGLDVNDSRMWNMRSRYNGAPSQRTCGYSPESGERSLDLSSWCRDPKGGQRPINAKGESVTRLPTFRDAHARRRCIVPVDGFFEWRAIKGARAKQPYDIAMKDGFTFWARWTVGELAQSKHGRVGTYVRHYHGTLQRTGAPKSTTACRRSLPPRALDQVDEVVFDQEDSRRVSTLR
jgi:putative SOS response-associated peptidase YedK